MKNVELKIGLPVTYYCGTDCYPYKVYNLASKHWISNEVNNGMYFKIVEDLFDEVEYNK